MVLIALSLVVIGHKRMYVISDHMGESPEGQTQGAQDDQRLHKADQALGLPQGRGVLGVASPSARLE